MSTISSNHHAIPTATPAKPVAEAHKSQATAPAATSAPAPKAESTADSKAPYQHASSAQALLSRYSSGDAAHAEGAAGVSAAPATASTDSPASASKDNPKPVAFDIYLNSKGGPSNQQQAQLLQGLKSRLKPGDQVGIALEGRQLGNPSSPGYQKQANATLNNLLSTTAKWKDALGPEGVDVYSKLRFERINTSSSDPGDVGLANAYNGVLKQREQAGLPMPNEINYDYEHGGDWSGNEWTPKNTANAGKLFSEGDNLVHSLDVNPGDSSDKVKFLVEPSVGAVPGTARSAGNPNAGPDARGNQVDLNWKELSKDADGFVFQTQRIPLGSGVDSGQTMEPAASGPDKMQDEHGDSAAFGDTVAALQKEVTAGNPNSIVQDQVSTMWSSPGTAIDAMAHEHSGDGSPDQSYLWWIDPGRTYAENESNLYQALDLRDSKFG